MHKCLFPINDLDIDKGKKISYVGREYDSRIIISLLMEEMQLTFLWFNMVLHFFRPTKYKKNNNLIKWEGNAAPTWVPLNLWIMLHLPTRGCSI